MNSKRGSTRNVLINVGKVYFSAIETAAGHRIKYHNDSIKWRLTVAADTIPGTRGPRHKGKKVGLFLLKTAL